ncbi:MAG: hypothetical protein QOG53_3235 [Frankiales bacterium]|jgi:hypothetical protein|nr:hypothetical protein [Frankiales bacterium]
MKRRLILVATATAVLAGGVGAASAAGGGSSPTSLNPRQHQFCVIIYDTRGGPPTPICLNW